MTLRELIEELHTIEDTYGDLEVLAASDEEGNHFGSLWRVTVELSRDDGDFEISLIHPEDWENYIEEAMLDEDIDREAAIEFLAKDGFRERVVVWP